MNHKIKVALAILAAIAIVIAIGVFLHPFVAVLASIPAGVGTMLFAREEDLGFD